MFSRVNVFLLWIAINAPTMASPTIEDHAFRAEIAPATEALQSLELPLEVLLNVTRADLGDITVFDAGGKVLPHLIRKPSIPVIHEKMNLKFHVFDSFGKQNARIVTIREQQLNDGSLSEHQTTETLESHQLKQDYLIELPENRSITEVELNWTQQPANQLLQVKLEAGNALDSLRTFDPGKTLSNLNPERPEWRIIKNIPQGQKYLRITAPNKIERFDLLQVIGHYQIITPEPVIWHEVKLSAQRIEDSDYLAFDSPSVVIPREIRIIPQEPHSSISGSLYASRDDFKQKRSIRSSFRQHNIESTEVKPNKPIQLAMQYYQHWWIAFESQPDLPPKVELAYPVSELVFLGNGNDPYSLAWGNYQSQGQTATLAELLNGNISQPENPSVKTFLKTIQSAGGINRLTPEAKLPWKQWLLWGLLIFAAAITARMALNLYREMNQ